MKKVLSFLTALVLFLVVVTASHFFVTNRLSVNNNQFSTWTGDAKFLSHDAITANLNKDSLVVFGSSEFQHGKNTPYHPENLFAGQKFNTMLIGAGYYQSLSHAITLASIQPEMQKQKAVLVVAPQWFRKSGVVPGAFASRFSETNFIAMLKNPDLSKKTRNAIVDRTMELLEADKPTLERVQLYKRMFVDKDADLMDGIYFQLYSLFLNEKSKMSVVSGIQASGMEYNQPPTAEPGEIDWEAYEKSAQLDGEKNTTSNSFYILDSYFKRNLESKLEGRKDSGVNSSYCTSPEYDDLRLFLQVCQDLKIQPMLVNVPVNGWWYDYTGFPKEDRQKYYQNIRDIAAEYGAEVADFSKDEYTEYFLEDTIHLGWKGWTQVNEAIYQFGKEN